MVGDFSAIQPFFDFIADVIHDVICALVGSVFPKVRFFLRVIGKAVVKVKMENQPNGATMLFGDCRKIVQWIAFDDAEQVFEITLAFRVSLVGGGMLDDSFSFGVFLAECLSWIVTRIKFSLDRRCELCFVGCDDGGCVVFGFFAHAVWCDLGFKVGIGNGRSARSTA